MESVVFALDPDDLLESKPDAIVVSPGEGYWNDFGFRIRIDIHFSKAIETGSAAPMSLSGFFGFVGSGTADRDRDVEKYDVRLLIKLLEAAPDRQLPANQLPTFFTMLPDMYSYREIVGVLGTKDATASLAALNDMVAGDEISSGATWLRDAKKTTVFQQAFLRSSESFYAWTNAGSLLRGLEYEEFGQISSGLRVNFHLNGRPTPHELSFKFNVKDDILPRRFAVMIGKNGVGKSQALGVIAKAALTGSQRLTDNDGYRPSLNRLLAFSPTSTSSSVFPADKRRNPKIWYRRFALAHQSGSRKGHSTGELILKIARSEERIGTNRRFQIFMNAIKAIDDWHEIGVRANSSYYMPCIPLDYLQRGGEQERLERFGSIDLRREPVRVIDGRPYQLSSGELSFLRFAAIASLHIENGTLLLFDEPETHLHPNFISQFVAVLNNLLEQTGSAAIIATHSVYFVREAFQDQVIVLRSDKDRSIRVERPSLRTFGADVGAISYFVFDEDEPSILAQEVEDRIANSTLSWPQILQSYKDSLSLELLGEIRARLEPSSPVRRT